jgi:hypothetical protein
LNLELLEPLLNLEPFLNLELENPYFIEGRTYLEIIPFAKQSTQ